MTRAPRTLLPRARMSLWGTRFPQLGKEKARGEEEKKKEGHVQFLCPSYAQFSYYNEKETNNELMFLSIPLFISFLILIINLIVACGRWMMHVTKHTILIKSLWNTQLNTVK